ncbi:hypothetical protein AQUSIP_12880 [Aquicella siphonis]|uniref:Uncharacterized protein n=1 Tax=Aquicella siphonis TaxID=254247 RepID=A0A5E4PHR1_9COXI|nr:hypothetical protein [Aquicella siphonis]VVC75987.1 hypothetical protein AQUSIP_12880 [Aquicella siphonis]
MDTLVKLGDFVFRDFEIPDYINFGGQQQLVQHDLIGGNRVVDSLGKNDTDISWSGLITGSDALERAEQLNLMRAQGQPLTLTWFNLSFTVIIQSLNLRTERYYKIDYDINLRVIIDRTNPNVNTTPVGFNEAINGDYTTILAIAANFINPALSSALTTLGTAIQAVPTFNGAQQSTTSPVVDAINATIDVVQQSINEIAGTSFGGST